MDDITANQILLMRNQN